MTPTVYELGRLERLSGPHSVGHIWVHSAQERQELRHRGARPSHAGLTLFGNTDSPIFSILNAHISRRFSVALCRPPFTAQWLRVSCLHFRNLRAARRQSAAGWLPPAAGRRRCHSAVLGAVTSRVMRYARSGRLA